MFEYEFIITGLDKNAYISLYYNNKEQLNEKKKKYRNENIEYFREYDRIKNKDENRIKQNK